MYDQQRWSVKGFMIEENFEQVLKKWSMSISSRWKGEKKTFQAEGPIEAKAYGFWTGHMYAAGGWGIWRKIQKE